jgi:hypothetical protein
MRQTQEAFDELDKRKRLAGVLDEDDAAAHARLAEETEQLREEIERQSNLGREQQKRLAAQAEERHAELMDALDTINQTSQQQLGALTKTLEAMEKANSITSQRLDQLERNMTKNVGDKDKQAAELRDIAESCKALAAAAKKNIDQRPSPIQADEIKVTLDNEALADAMAALRAADNDKMNEALRGVLARNREAQEEILRDMTATLTDHSKNLSDMFKRAAEQNADALANENDRFLKAFGEKLAGNVDGKVLKDFHDTCRDQARKIAEQGEALAELKRTADILAKRPGVPITEELLAPIRAEHEKAMQGMRKQLENENLELVKNITGLAALVEDQRKTIAAMKAAQAVPELRPEAQKLQEEVNNKHRHVVEQEDATKKSMENVTELNKQTAKQARKIAKDEKKALGEARRKAEKIADGLQPAISKLGRLQQLRKKAAAAPPPVVADIVPPVAVTPVATPTPAAEQNVPSPVNILPRRAQGQQPFQFKPEGIPMREEQEKPDLERQQYEADKVQRKKEELHNQNVSEELARRRAERRNERGEAEVFRQEEEAKQLARQAEIARREADEAAMAEAVAADVVAERQNQALLEGQQQVLAEEAAFEASLTQEQRQALDAEMDRRIEEAQKAYAEMEMQYSGLTRHQRAAPEVQQLQRAGQAKQAEVAALQELRRNPSRAARFLGKYQQVAPEKRGSTTPVSVMSAVQRAPTGGGAGRTGSARLPAGFNKGADKGKEEAATTAPAFEIEEPEEVMSYAAPKRLQDEQAAAVEAATQEVTLDLIQRLDKLRNKQLEQEQIALLADELKNIYGPLRRQAKDVLSREEYEMLPKHWDSNMDMARVSEVLVKALNNATKYARDFEGGVKKKKGQGQQLGQAQFVRMVTGQ